MAPVTSVQITGPRTPHSKVEPRNDVDQNIQVFIRCRPLNEKNGEKKSVVDICTGSKEVKLHERIGGNVGDKFNRVFTYDDVFDQNSCQIEVYRSVVEPLIDQVLAGYNCTVFAYGQTGTGKTFTMEGERSDTTCSWEDDPRCGIIPRALHQLFETLIMDSSNSEHSVSVSFMELYNEELYDLLNPSEDMVRLKIYDDSAKKGKVIVGGLSEVTVHSKAEIYDILQKGSAKRQTAATKLNACSSRSHTIFAVTVRIKENSMDGEEMLKIGKLNLVDLAGSENIGRSGAIEKRAREAGNINQSLLTLGRVITCLVEKTPHIPYRESKLTRLLRDSLGGGTKTSIIATISPNVLDAEDTLSTLDYAQRAKKIMNKPEINQKLSKKTLLREYTNEIERLRRDLEAARGGGNAMSVDKDNYESLVAQSEKQTKDIEEKEAAIRLLKEEVERIEGMFSVTQAELEEKKEQLVVTTATLESTEVILGETKETLAVVSQDCNEQKHLVFVHSETEKKLSAQANALLNVAETTTEHVSKLHQKVDRQQNLESNNFQKLDNFRTNFKQNMAKLEEFVKSSDNGYIEELESNIKAKFDNIAEALKSSETKFGETEATIMSSLQEISSLESEDISVKQGLEVLVEKSATLEKSASAASQSLRESIMTSVQDSRNDIAKVVQLVTGQRAEIEQMLMKQSAYIKKIQEDRVRAFDAIVTGVTKAFEEERQEFDRYKQEVECIRKEHDSNAEIAHSQQQKIMKNIEQQMKELQQLSVSQTITSGKTSSELENLSAKFVESNLRAEKKGADICAQVNSFEETLKKSDDIGVQIVNELDGQVSTNIQRNVDLLSSGDENLKMRMDLHLSAVAETETSIIRDVKAIATLQTGLSQIVEASIAERAAKIDATRDTLTKEMVKINSGHATVTSVSNDAGSSLHHDATVLKIHNRGSQKTILKEIASRVSEFNSFTKKDLMKDVPTGTTPQKTNYQYPTSLVQTSPHEKILSRYRAATNISVAALCELPETSGEIEFDSPSISGSEDSLVSNNAENLEPAQTKNSISKTKIKPSISSSSINEKVTKKKQQKPQALRTKPTNC